MGRFTQTEIKTKADEWARKGEEIEKASAARDKALEPYIAGYNDAIAPVLAKYEPKIDRLTRERNEIEAEVIGWLNGVGKPLALTGELAVATVESKIGSRAIDVEKFFAAVKDKNAAFWACFSVLVAKAEKLLGAAKVDEISTKPTKLVASLKRK